MTTTRTFTIREDGAGQAGPRFTHASNDEQYHLQVMAYKPDVIGRVQPVTVLEVHIYPEGDGIRIVTRDEENGEHTTWESTGGEHEG